MGNLVCISSTPQSYVQVLEDQLLHNGEWRLILERLMKVELRGRDDFAWLQHIRISKPRSPRYFHIIAGRRGRTRVSDAFIDKTVFGALRGAQPLFCALFGVKTLSGTLSRLQ